MTMERAEEIRSEVAHMVASGGREALISMLMGLGLPAKDVGEEGEFARWGLMSLRELSPESWAEDLVLLVTRTNSEEVADRVRHWELDSLSFQVDERERDRIVAMIRGAMMSGSERTRLSAARAMMAFGYRYHGIAADLESLQELAWTSAEDRARVLLVTAFFGVRSVDEIAPKISELLNLAGPEGTTAHLAGMYGTPIHADPLVASALRGSHQAMIALMGLAVRFKQSAELQSKTLETFLEVDRTVSFGLEHYAIRLFDDERLLGRFLMGSLEGLERGGPGLAETNLLKRCNRPGQFRFFGRSALTLVAPYLPMLQSLVETSTGYEGTWPTHETYRKESALTIAVRLAMPEVRAWVAKGIAIESTPWLVARMAKDCCFWNVADFAVALGPRMAEPGERNPMWLISDESGVVGQEATLATLLASDGRTRNSEWDVLATYVEGLALCAYNIGSTKLLEDAMLDPRVPKWTRDGAAHAIRQASSYEPQPAIDWERVKQYLSDPSNSEFARHELLISLAIYRPAEAEVVIRNLPAEEKNRTRVTLAAVFAALDISAQIDRLSQYKRPAPSPYEHTFEDGYACLCLVQLYERGLVDEATVCELLRNGLTYEADSFILRLQGVRTEDRQLLDVLAATALDRNSEWRSYPALWPAMERLSPGWLLEPGVIDHALGASDHALKGYLDALIEHRRSIKNSGGRIVEILSRIMRERDRSLAWSAAFALSVTNPEIAQRLVAGDTPSSDRELRSLLELAVWGEDSVWELACRTMSHVSWMTLVEYVRSLEVVREQDFLAQFHWNAFLSSDFELDGWRHIQALLQLPSERIRLAASEWQPDSVRHRFIKSWFTEQYDKKIKKSRETLWREGRMPGEDAFPRAV